MNGSLEFASKINQIKANWSEHRCQPSIMPFASFFGVNPKENFDFCMGNIFQSHSTPYMGSTASLFDKFSGSLKSIFSSITSMRTTIATLGGGINSVFQEFTDRIKNFFFQLRLSAIRLKSLFVRMYGILFSVMYMGMSGISGMSSFTNTYLFSFLNTFCFPGNTSIIIQSDDYSMPCHIRDISIGDILLPGNSRVTGTFEFYAKGQPMVQLGPIVVSTNHYVMYKGKPIKAGDHPFAIKIEDWDSEESLYCLNTDTHHIPIHYFTFLDYDETHEGDKKTMAWVEEQVNGVEEKHDHGFSEYGAAMDENTLVHTNKGWISAKEVRMGEVLSTGSTVVGIIHKEVQEIGIEHAITPSTLYWNESKKKWIRYGDDYPWKKEKQEWISFIVTPNSQIEIGDFRIRDYLEVCSPDSEHYYTEALK